MKRNRSETDAKRDLVIGREGDCPSRVSAAVAGECIGPRPQTTRASGRAGARARACARRAVSTPLIRAHSSPLLADSAVVVVKRSEGTELKLGADHRGATPSPSSEKRRTGESQRFVRHRDHRARRKWIQGRRTPALPDRFAIVVWLHTLARGGASWMDRVCGGGGLILDHRTLTLHDSATTTK